ncbi:hypothetical protein [Murimonas intestini]|uniref:DUF4231 domain-containing protein n=1 Tax=Murimonas intestini TaxID=1337051 RepID=A0AB73TA45_9FIRM|nr:hypothetical protein [Murimonas intestini]MCR1839214.1 hypothetical protein [Murimonas intestini]MCR1864510.1 hypothetical protein [Murimonas intestini]MCR1882120.1 hypothetical protein [Murimonas intestini]
MKEERFEASMEHFGDAIEKTVEGAAKVIDKSVNLAWKFRPVRFAGNTLTFLTGAGLIASSVPLDEKGYHKTAKACLIGGSLVIIIRIVELAVFRRK